MNRRKHRSDRHADRRRQAQPGRQADSQTDRQTDKIDRQSDADVIMAGKRFVIVFHYWYIQAGKQAGQATAGPTFGMHLAPCAWSIAIQLGQCGPWRPCVRSAR